MPNTDEIHGSRSSAVTVVTLQRPLELGGIRGGEEHGEAVDGGDGGPEDGADGLQEDAALDLAGGAGGRGGDVVHVEEIRLVGDGLVGGAGGVDGVEDHLKQASAHEDH